MERHVEGTHWNFLRDANLMRTYIILEHIFVEKYGNMEHFYLETRLPKAMENIHSGKGTLFSQTIPLFFLFLHENMGVVGWCEGAVYLTSLGRPTDIGLQLGKACYPCSG